MRLPNALELQASLDSPFITGERLVRRMKHSTRHAACAELAKHLAGTGYALRATNAQMRSGAKTMLAMAAKQARLGESDGF